MQFHYKGGNEYMNNFLEMSVATNTEKHNTWTVWLVILLREESHEKKGCVY